MKKIPAILLIILTAVSLAVAAWSLYESALLPGKLVVLIAILFALLTILVGVLVTGKVKSARFWIGVVLAILLIAGAITGSYMLNNAVKTMREITKTGAEYSHVGIYVKLEDPAVALEETKDYTFGILEKQDWVNTASALLKVQEAIGKEPTVKYYGGLATLAHGFENGECNALIINVEYLKVIAELDGLENIEDWTRELTVVKIEQPTEPPTEPPTTVPTTVATTAPEETTEETEPYIEIPPEIFSVYLSGNDATGEIAEKGRSDTNILAVVNTGTRQVLLISTPRDSYLPLPAVGGWMDKLTHAGIYGLQSSMDTLGNLYGLDVDYFFRVNFTGFKEIINALGGITVYSEKEFVSFADEDFIFQVGENEVDGVEALVFARDRNNFADGDNARGRHQMEVIRATVRKMCSPAILKNYKELLKALEGSFYSNMPYEKMAELVRLQLQDPQDWEFVSVSAEGVGASKECYSAGCELYVIYLSDESVSTIRSLISSMLAGERIQQPE